MEVQSFPIEPQTSTIGPKAGGIGAVVVVMVLVVVLSSLSGKIVEVKSSPLEPKTSTLVLKQEVLVL